MFSSEDYMHMAHALQLAEKGLDTTTPNPRVGCVITRNNQVVGSGWHEQAGAAHAEINALAVAGEKARGATVYVTLEPCCHQGRTPPCVEALIRAAVARVVIAMEDPNPLMSGSGIETLKQVGIAVQSGLLQEQARALNPGFVKRMQHGKPWVRLKTAVSLDGKTALNNGQSQWISCEAARIDGHRWRARSCAILTGIGTILADDAQLTVRHISASRQPKKIIVDNRLDIPLNASVLQGEDVFIFTASTEETSKTNILEKMGTTQVIVFEGSGARVNLDRMMTTLAKLGMNEILVEAGSRLGGALIQDGLVDELIIYMAPSLLGSNAKGMFQLPELASLQHKTALNIEDVRMIGSDVRIIARL